MLSFEMEFLLHTQRFINQLRNIFKCQKCFKEKDEESLRHYRDCDHMFCTDCLKNNEPCILCQFNDPFNARQKPVELTKSKNLTSILQIMRVHKFPSLLDEIVRLLTAEGTKNKEKSLGKAQKSISLLAASRPIGMKDDGSDMFPVAGNNDEKNLKVANSDKNDKCCSSAKNGVKGAAETEKGNQVKVTSLVSEINKENHIESVVESEDCQLTPDFIFSSLNNSCNVQKRKPKLGLTKKSIVKKDRNLNTGVLSETFKEKTVQSSVAVPDRSTKRSADETPGVSGRAIEEQSKSKNEDVKSSPSTRSRKSRKQIIDDPMVPDVSVGLSKTHLAQKTSANDKPRAEIANSSLCNSPSTRSRTKAADNKSEKTDSSLDLSSIRSKRRNANSKTANLADSPYDFLKSDGTNKPGETPDISSCRTQSTRNQTKRAVQNVFETNICATPKSRAKKSVNDSALKSVQQKNSAQKRTASQAEEADVKVMGTPKAVNETPKKRRNVNKSSPLLSETSFDSSTNKIKTLNVSKRNHKGETPLHLACRKGNLTLMQELIDAGANPNVKDNAGWAPLHDSIAFGKKDVIQFLLKNGAMVNTPGLENMTPLHLSIREGLSDVTQLLLEYGADQSLRNIYGETPLDLVKKQGLAQLENVLKSTPARFKTKPKNCEEPNEIVLYNCNLDDKETNTFKEFVKEFKCKTADKLVSQTRVTHIVTSESKPLDIDWRIIPGVPLGCYILSSYWMRESLKFKKIQLTELKEVEDLKLNFRKARQNSLNQLPGLFSGFHFYFGGSSQIYKTKKMSFLKIELKVLVEKNGGIILSRNPDPESLSLERTFPFHAEKENSLFGTSYITVYCKDSWDPFPKYNMQHMKTLPVEWLLDCIWRWELVDPNVDQSYMDRY